MNADVKTAAARRVKNGRRQHGNPAPLPAQPAPPTAQAEPRAARPANPPNPPLLKGGDGGAGRTLYGTQLADALAGDVATYTGPLKHLQGKRCTVDSWTPTFKRVRAIFAIDGRPAMRLVTPANLKRSGGGYWRRAMRADPAAIE